MDKSKDKVDFSAALKELEGIAAWFESQEIDLDEGLKKFERGMELATQLKHRLSEVENEVAKIKVKFDLEKPEGGSEPPSGNERLL